MYPNLLRALFLSAGLLAGTAWAGDQHYKLNLPAGSLSAAVETLARQANLQVLFDQKLLEGKTTAGLSGDYTAREALEKLLSGSGIGFSFTAEKAVAIKKLPTEGVKNTLEAVIVLGTKERRETLLDMPATAGSHLGLTMRETPASIDVIARETMRERGETTAIQALSNATGVSVGQPAYRLGNLPPDRLTQCADLTVRPYNCPRCITDCAIRGFRCRLAIRSIMIASRL